jgi:hypothetical protein
MAQRQFCNRHQYAFLRQVRNHPHGLPVDEWPATSTLRRWMRHEGFRSALQGILMMFRMEKELMTAGAAARAAQSVQRFLSDYGDVRQLESVGHFREDLATLLRVIRLDWDHARGASAVRLQPRPAEPPPTGQHPMQAVITLGKQVVERNKGLVLSAGVAEENLDDTADDPTVAPEGVREEGTP